MGEHTYGAGCGHTDDGTPTTLKNTGAVLQVPDCWGLRADGSKRDSWRRVRCAGRFSPNGPAALEGGGISRKVAGSTGSGRRQSQMTPAVPTTLITCE